MIKKVELEGGYSVCVENDIEKKKTTLGVAGWQLMFTSKDEVKDFIALLEKAMEFWEYEQPPHQ